MEFGWKVPKASSRNAKRRMQLQKRSNTLPELRIRRLLFANGLRYRIDYALQISRRRKADIAFPALKLAVFIDGCFWHGCPIHGTLPKYTNASFWKEKIAANRARDKETDQLLRESGWTVLRFWEHDDPSMAALAIGTLIENLKDAR